MVPRIPTYLGLIALECGLAWFAIARSRAAGWTVREVIGELPRRPLAIARDIAIGFAMWGAWSLISALWATHQRTAVSSMLPVTTLERIVWIALSITAGIVEEFVFRGYLQRWATRRFASVTLGILLQGAVFGVMHGYQGAALVLKIAVYGVSFGVLAHSRRSTVPGMVAHAWTDIASGIFHR
jgi:membrane protease YdiL (CAAX protease family)